MAVILELQNTTALIERTHIFLYKKVLEILNSSDQKKAMEPALKNWPAI